MSDRGLVSQIQHEPSLHLLGVGKCIDGFCCSSQNPNRNRINLNGCQKGYFKFWWDEEPRALISRVSVPTHDKNDSLSLSAFILWHRPETCFITRDYTNWVLSSTQNTDGYVLICLLFAYRPMHWFYLISLALIVVRYIEKIRLQTVHL